MKTDIVFKKTDIENAFKLHYNSKYPIRSRLMLFAGFFLWFLSMIFTYFNFPDSYPYLKYLLGVVGVFYIAMFYYRRKKLFERASKQTAFQGEFTFEINDKGIVFGKKEGVSNCSWSEIEDIVKDEYTVLFYFGKDRFYILPLESLSEEQQDSLADVLSKQDINIIEA